MTLIEEIDAIHPDALVMWDKAMQETGFEIPEFVRIVPVTLATELPYKVIATSERFIAAWCGKRWVIRKITDWEKFVIPCNQALFDYGAELYQDFMNRIDDACVEAGFRNRYSSARPS